MTVFERRISCTGGIAGARTGRTGHPEAAIADVLELLPQIDAVGPRRMLKWAVGGFLVYANHSCWHGSAGLPAVLLLCIFNAIYILICFPQLLVRTVHILIRFAPFTPFMPPDHAPILCMLRMCYLCCTRLRIPVIWRSRLVGDSCGCASRDRWCCGDSAALRNLAASASSHTLQASPEDDLILRLPLLDRIGCMHVWHVVALNCMPAWYSKTQAALRLLNSTCSTGIGATVGADATAARWHSCIIA